MRGASSSLVVTAENIMGVQLTMVVSQRSVKPFPQGKQSRFESYHSHKKLGSRLMKDAGLRLEMKVHYFPTWLKNILKYDTN